MIYCYSSVTVSQCQSLSQCLIPKQHWNAYWKPCNCVEHKRNVSSEALVNLIVTSNTTIDYNNYYIDGIIIGYGQFKLQILMVKRAEV